MIAAMLGQLAEDDIIRPNVDWGAILPETILVGGALVLLVVVALRRAPVRRGALASATVLIAGAAGGASWWLWDRVTDGEGGSALAGAVMVDGFSVFFKVTVCIAVVLAALLSDAYLRDEGLEGSEYYVLVLLSATGAMVMAGANDLIVLFLGLEILSIALYVLAGYHLRRTQSQEAAIKYFVLGSFSSAFLLYGIALVYGATGSTNLTEVASFLASNQLGGSGVFLGGMALLLVGLGFKVAAVPFHMWTPDVYQGSPSPVAGFMAAAAKAAGFAGLLRVFFSTFNLYVDDWRPVVWALAVLSLVVGSVLAVVQSDVKRMMAYSSISHAGYVLVGLQAGSRDGISGSLFYLLAYTFMVLGTFAVITLVGRRGDDHHDLEHYRGLAARQPALALGFTVLLLAQAGVPLTSGFLAKFLVITAAVEAESYALAVVAMVAAVIAAFLYLRVIVLMYMTSTAEGEDAPARIHVPAGAKVALLATVAFTVIVGIVPAGVIDFARDATLLL